MRNLLAVLLVACLSALSEAQSPGLDRKVKDAIRGFEGTVSLYAKNLDSGKTYGVEGGEKVRTASTISFRPLGWTTWTTTST